MRTTPFLDVKAPYKHLELTRAALREYECNGDFPWLGLAFPAFRGHFITQLVPASDPPTDSSRLHFNLKVHVTYM